jgi:spore germination cell wall hydrolase CwlJ-like protein
MYFTRKEISWKNEKCRQQASAAMLIWNAGIKYIFNYRTGETNMGWSWQKSCTLAVQSWSDQNALFIVPESRLTKS